MQEDDDQIAEAEREPGGPEGIRDRERTNEKAGHAADEEEALRGVGRRELIGEPGVAAVHPEEDGEDEQHLQGAFERQVMLEIRGELRQGEDEDEVEEELQAGDADLVLLARAGRAIGRGRSFVRQVPRPSTVRACGSSTTGDHGRAAEG